MGTKKTTTTEVALPKTQQDIPAMLETVNKQLKALVGNTTGNTKTTGELPGFGKIKDIKTVAQLVSAHSSVVNRAAAYKASANAIIPKGIKTPPFKIGGSTESEWVADIKERVAVVANKEAIARLKKVKTLLEGNLSAEAKLAKELEEVANILTGEA